MSYNIIVCPNVNCATFVQPKCSLRCLIVFTFDLPVEGVQEAAANMHSEVTHCSKLDYPVLFDVF